MRDIKFRAWDKRDKKMSSMDGNYYSYKPYNDKNKYVWMQYTGLKDKNGKEIYEGDILGEKKDCGKENCDAKHQIEPKAVCRWIKHKFEVIDFGNSHYSLDWVCKGMEIIGNIYENPELK